MNTAQAIKQTTTVTHAKTISWKTVMAITAATLIGTLIIAGVGFAAPEIMHSAAHDLRHGLVFPCH